MIETITETELPVNEKLLIRRRRIVPAGMDEEQLSKLKRISIITGIHGDELEGQYVAYETGRRAEAEIQNLNGIIDIYPAMNPMGIDSIIRGLPGFDLDMNRIFPGHEDGDMYEYTAEQIICDLAGSDLAVDIHASNVFLTEIPQIRINELHESILVPYALKMNVDLIWVHSNATVLQSTLAYALNSIGTKTLVVETGVGMRITRSFGDQITDGIFNTMKAMGMWKGSTVPVKKPMISDHYGDVDFLNAPCSGVFMKELDAGTHVQEGQLIGTVLNPLTGNHQEIRAADTGVLFTIREYPIVDEGSLMGRILKDRR